jgi:SNF2 family DNA or RNA helicase
MEKLNQFYPDFELGDEVSPEISGSFENTSGRTPYLYQHKCIDWAIEKIKAGQTALPLFVEMRLGKTLMTLKVLKYLMDRGEVSRVLIVCPKTVIPVWERELKLEDQVGLRFDTKLVRTPLVKVVEVGLCNS